MTAGLPKKGRGAKVTNAKKDQEPQGVESSEQTEPCMMNESHTHADLLEETQLADALMADEEPGSAKNPKPQEMEAQDINELMGLDGSTINQGGETRNDEQDVMTPTSTTHLLKRKSETDDEANFVPGPNPFIPLFAKTEPVVKKARSNEQGEEDEGDDLDEYQEEEEMQHVHPHHPPVITFRKTKLTVQTSSHAPSDTGDTEEQIESDNDTIEISMVPCTLMVNAPRNDARLAATMTADHPLDPFARRLPGFADGENENASLLHTGSHLPAQAPPLPHAPTWHKDPQVFVNRTAPDLAEMFAPTTSSSHTATPTTRGDQPITIHREFTGTFGPHSIPPQHVFHNYDSTQVRTLFSTRQPGDILIIDQGNPQSFLPEQDAYPPDCPSLPPTLTPYQGPADEPPGSVRSEFADFMH
ncbi:hypothetical protein EV421DRAFT_1914487 [Armillaria borealis]|uniref:Uncharacterized protein n=1 Tax=Armillaria borealis TaxID=47425 RepID=A0AA39ITS1_9AGAR|nr:hypothetical protein EV421DRAFT_1914487 [Armillaria borealis]